MSSLVNEQPGVVVDSRAGRRHEVVCIESGLDEVHIGVGRPDRSVPVHGSHVAKQSHFPKRCSNHVYRLVDLKGNGHCAPK